MAAPWSPSIFPDHDQNVYLVVDDLGDLGRIYRETDTGATDVETIIRDLMAGQYSNPVQVVALTPQRAGLKMCPSMSPGKSAGAATVPITTYPLTLALSSIDMRAMTCSSD